MADTTTDILTAERDAVWESIKGYVFLEGGGVDRTLFLRVFRWQDDNGEVRWETSIPPALTLMPAISIRSVEGEEKWEQHQGKRLVHRIEIKVWTRYQNQKTAGRIWKWIRRALHQVPSRDRTHLRDASGSAVFNVSFPVMRLDACETKPDLNQFGQLVRTLGSPCTETTFYIDVPHEDDPMTDND